MIARRKRVKRRNGKRGSLKRERNLRKLLEIGAGPGHHAKFFQDNGIAVKCIDLSPKMVKLCIDKGLDAQEMDFSRLTFSNDSFDAVWALNCLLHVPKVELPGVLVRD